jgi:hypothetical protein
MICSGASGRDDAFSLKAVLRALDQDRAAVRRFRLHDPAGAHTIADYLTIFLDKLDRIGEEATRVAARPVPRWHGGPPNISWGGQYAEDPDRSRRTVPLAHHARVH